MTRTRYRVAVRARRRVAEHFCESDFNFVVDHMLPFAGFVMCGRPRQTQNVDQETLGESVFAHDALGEFAT